MKLTLINIVLSQGDGEDPNWGGGDSEDYFLVINFLFLFLFLDLHLLKLILIF